MAASPRAFALLALALAAAGAAGGADLGTLFHTPEERERLDRLRRGESLEATPEDGPGVAPRVSGFVRRSDGRDSVFLDGRAYPAAGARLAPLKQPRAVTPPGAPLPDSAVKVEPKPKG